MLKELIISEANQMAETIRRDREYLHRHAETGFDLPETCERLALRPVRYLSGECEAEEIVLD